MWSLQSVHSRQGEQRTIVSPYEQLFLPYMDYDISMRIWYKIIIILKNVLFQHLVTL